MTSPLDPRPVMSTPISAAGGSTTPQPAPAQQSDPRGAGPIPKEIPIVATGARPGGSTEARELFCEDTTTVLVFEKGAVIRLSAAIVPGQLIFLTNVLTKKEVVAQVMLKRSGQTSSPYAELQFTEEAPDFWGLSFSTHAPTGEASVSTGKMGPANGEEYVAEHPPLEMAAPAAGEMEKLRKEVEALRQSLASLTQAAAPQRTQTQPAQAIAENTPVALPRQNLPTHAEDGPAAHSLTAGVLAPSSPAKPSVSAAQKSPAKNEEAPSAPALTEALLAATSAPTKPPAPSERNALPTMALPKARSGDEHSGSHSRADEELGSLVHQSEAAHDEGELLPEASLDFDAAPPAKAKRKASRTSELAIPASVGGFSRLRLAILCAVLAVCAAGAAWYEQWLPRALAAKLPAPETLFSFHSSASAAPRPKPAPILANRAKPVPIAVKAAPEPKPAVEAAATAPTEGVKPTSDEPGESVREEAPSEKESEAAGTTRSKRAKITGQEARLRPASAASTLDPAAIGPSIAPKLLKTVRPVAPPQAIRSYVTGNVEVDALVNAEGRVASAEALSGPEPLRDAAISTVKQYKYAPATRGGKAVPAHVKVTVQFWYEP